MAWGSKTQIANGLSVAGTELFSDAVTLNPGALANVQVTTDSNGTTDNLNIKVYTTLDASSEAWDTVPFTSFQLVATSGNLVSLSFLLSGVYKFRLGFVRSGSTDTLATNAYYREDGVSL